MDAQVKQRWVEALHSGHYAQTRGVLRDSCGYCCLGVLCDVVDPTGWEEEDRSQHELKDEGGELLSAEALDFLGLDHEMQKGLAALNDDGTGFDYIADYIERSV